jgi:hypothetical protein
MHPSVPSMQEDSAEKMDELLVPIEVSETLKSIKEPLPIYSGTSQPQ